MILYSGISRLGKREKNEDYFRIWDGGSKYMFALADGLGGHKKGEKASELVVETSIFLAKDDIPFDEMLDHCFIEGQNNLLNEQRMQNMINDMKTTEVLLFIQDENAVWGHIGDSRLYRFKKKFLSYGYERTIDHSAVQNMALSGMIKEKDIRFHEDRNILLKAMGSDWETPQYTIDKTIHLEDDEFFLLCTDGFWEWITEKKMIECLKLSATPDEWLDRMERIIVENVGSSPCDNYMAIAVFYKKEG